MFCSSKTLIYICNTEMKQKRGRPIPPDIKKFTIMKIQSLFITAFTAVEVAILIIALLFA